MALLTRANPVRVVSHAQNFEDVMLWRTLHHVPRGFYIDVGAADPDEDSVTRLFYESGWQGLNIEPSSEFYPRLDALRKRDVNLNLAIGAIPGHVEFFQIPGTGLSTLDADTAAMHQAAGWAVEKRMVEQATLADVCRHYAPSEIHFLKVDVEGSERSVLQGADFSAFRPWIVLVEATRPQSQVPNHEEWDSLVTSAGYRFAWFDGLNRFYIAEEQWETLHPRMQVPPNVFDGFARAADLKLVEDCRLALKEAEESRAAEIVRAAEAVAARQAAEAACASAVAAAVHAAEAAGQRAMAAERRAIAAEANAAEQATRAQAAEQRALERAMLAQPEEAEARVLRERAAMHASRADAACRWLDAMQNSTSWRLTAPLRALREWGSRRTGASLSSLDLFQSYGGPTKPTIFIECTHTYLSDLNTGIQRVVRNILRNAETVAAQYGYAVAPVMLERGQLISVDPIVVLRNKQLAQHQTLAPRTGVVAASMSITLDTRESCASDILVLLDASWYFPLWPAVEDFKRRGGHVVAIIYDLIPMTHSHACGPELVAYFKRWFLKVARNADVLIGISQTVVHQIRDYLTSNVDGSGDVPIAHFYLGSELDFATNCDEVRPIIRTLFDANRHVFLVVGSIEPRKNQGFVLDAFDRFWSKGGDASLVIVGRQGWKMNEFLDRALAHPEWRHQLHVLRDANDSELEYGYTKASALIVASEIEGFGLPIVEAFQRGLPVLCSDIPVFREIADGRATFFDLADPDRLTDVVAEFCNSHDPIDRSNRTPQPWLTWRQSTEKLFATMMAILAR